MRGLPLVGALPEFMKDPPGTVLRAARAHPGELFGLRLGPVTAYVVSQPEHVQQVVHNPRSFSKGGRMWDGARLLVGNGLATSGGALWLRQRRLMQPLFLPAHIASLVDTIVDVLEREVERFVAHAGTGEVLDMDVEAMHLTQQVLLAAMFGASISASYAAQLGRDIQAAMRSLSLRMFLHFIPRRLPLPGDRRFNDAVARIDAVMMRLVAERRRSGLERADLVSSLLRAHVEGVEQGMDDAQIRDELVTMFIAGNEALAMTLTWAWYELDQHPEVARKLRAEINAVLGDRRPTYADLERLVYTRYTLMETMRRYPSAWAFPRFTEGPELVGGYQLPARATLLVSPLATHCDPAIWDRPELFDPDRFSPERSAGRSRYAYYPFGDGPRQCIANNLAMAAAQLTLAMMAPRVRPRLAPGQRVALGTAISLKPRYGMKMRVDAVERSV
ncbi:MAG TPA: cytochrome P450 [Polyangiaceae bacterium]|nr:cytochrome P450 [Polyangiaceae bacterium]